MGRGDRRSVSSLQETNPEISPLALYYNNDGNRQNLFIWINFLWAVGARIFNDDFTAGWTTEEALSRDGGLYRSAHRAPGHQPKQRLPLWNRMHGSRSCKGNSAMIPVWWWAYSGFINPESSTLTEDQVGFVGMPAYQGTTATYAISMPFSISSYSSKPRARPGNSSNGCRTRTWTAPTP